MPHQKIKLTIQTTKQHHPSNNQLPSTYKKPTYKGIIIKSSKTSNTRNLTRSYNTNRRHPNALKELCRSGNPFITLKRYTLSQHTYTTLINYALLVCTTKQYASLFAQHIKTMNHQLNLVRETYIMYNVLPVNAKNTNNALNLPAKKYQIFNPLMKDNKAIITSKKSRNKLSTVCTTQHIQQMYYNIIQAKFNTKHHDLCPQTRKQNTVTAWPHKRNLQTQSRVDIVAAPKQSYKYVNNIYQYKRIARKFNKISSQITANHHKGKQINTTTAISKVITVNLQPCAYSKYMLLANTTTLIVLTNIHYNAIQPVLTTQSPTKASTTQLGANNSNAHNTKNNTIYMHNKSANYHKFQESNEHQTHTNKSAIQSTDTRTLTEYPNHYANNTQLIIPAQNYVNYLNQHTTNPSSNTTYPCNLTPTPFIKHKPPSKPTIHRKTITLHTSVNHALHLLTINHRVLTSFSSPHTSSYLMRYKTHTALYSDSTALTRTQLHEPRNHQSIQNYTPETTPTNTYAYINFHKPRKTSTHKSHLHFTSVPANRLQTQIPTLNKHRFPLTAVINAYKSPLRNAFPPITYPAV
eukprot:gene3245-2227_t